MGGDCEWDMTRIKVARGGLGFEAEFEMEKSPLHRSRWTDPSIRFRDRTLS